MALFQPSVLNKYLKLQDKEVTAKAYKKFVKHFHNATIQENIKNSKEEEYQGPFLLDLFVNILGYTMKPQPKFNLVAEQKNQTNSKKSDGAILKEDTAIGVIELKGTKTTDLKSITEQAFGYKVNQKGCIYVITSNYEKLRFYINDATEFVEFNLFTLTEKDFELLYLCTSKESIFLDLPHKIKTESLVKEEQITKEFYKDYSQFKRELFRDLVKLNAKNLKTPKQTELAEASLEDEQLQKELVRLEKNVKLALFKKSQKLIDRFLFIFFAEDRDLLTPNSTLLILNKWKDDVAFGDERPLYNLFKTYFNFLDKGRKEVLPKDGRKGRPEIYAYNGGLFKPDSILDRIEISDELLYEHTLKLSNYDFDSQIDVNILGHIFENSLNEIESVNAEIEGGDFDKQKSKRKKDGVFYTPKYITKYIVENTVGKLCEEKKFSLGIYEEEYAKGRFNRSKEIVKKLDKALFSYREWLLQLTICDPACGSGAFLNQALEFLINEHQYISELEGMLLTKDTKTKGIQTAFATENIENTILENNIFGVDLNEESVEIAKLSLWLRTAQPRRKLNNLSSNLKCGNSLIESKTIAGDKAFNWEEQFPQVFEKGGFDVIIGNPPYVRADSPGNLIPFREHMVACGKYLSLKGKWDLYIPFIELSNDILNTKGLSSLIIPDAYCHADYSTKSLELYKKNGFLERIDYYPNIEVFANVGVKSIIVSFRKDKSNTKFTARVHKEDSTYTEATLDNYPKSFRLDYADSLIQTVKNGVNINEILYISKGIVGNSCEKKYKGEFKVGDLLSNKKNEINSKLYYEGKNINKWNLDSERWIEYNTERSPSKWSRKGFSEFFLANKITVMRSPGNTPRAFLDTQQGIFNESAIGFVRWHDLKGVKNKSISKSYKNEKERIQFEKLSEKLSLDYIIAIMNSELIRYELNSNRRSNIHIYPDDWRKMKIVNIDKESQYPFINLVKRIRENTSQLNKINRNFTTYLKSQFPLEKTSKKLQNWYELEFGEFIKELNKAIKSLNKERAKNGETLVEVLTKSDEMEWMELFNTKKAEAQALKSQIDQTDREIDQMVYKLYELTDEEIEIVENS